MRLVQAVTTTKTRSPRRSPRLPLKVTAQLRLSERQPAVPVSLRNISVGGASMVGSVRLRNNDRVSLSLLLGASLKFDLRARVVHAGNREGASFKYGLKFLALTESDYNRLTGFIHDPQNGWQFDAPPPPWEPESV
jgi:hypothetical protein